jgi:CDP-glucose 4,6-dehydratase
MPDRDFWRGRRVLVTGHTGFKGSWLSAWLLQLGARVHGVALAPTSRPSLFELNRLADRMDHSLGDLRDRHTADTAVRRAEPEVVFHLAAQAIVRHGLRYPAETFETNVMGTVHLLDAVRSAPSVRAVVVVTSDKCYEETATDRGYREDDALGGRDPYSASKGCQEIVAHAYRRSFLEGRLATARAGNVIGGGDWAEDRVIPDAVRALGDQRPLCLRNPRAIRPWQHVLEPLSGYLRLAERLYQGHPVDRAWNFGPAEADAATVGDLIDRFHRVWGRGSWVSVADPDAGKEAAVLRLDAAQARQQLGWQPRVGLERAIQLTVEWYREVIEAQADPFGLLCHQTRAYEGVETA